MHISTEKDSIMIKYAQVSPWFAHDMHVCTHTHTRAHVYTCTHTLSYLGNEHRRRSWRKVSPRVKKETTVHRSFKVLMDKRFGILTIRRRLKPCCSKEQQLLDTLL